MNVTQNQFEDLVTAVNQIGQLGIPVYALSGVFALIGTHPTPLTTDMIYRAWQSYQASPAFKSLGTVGTASRAAS